MNWRETMARVDSDPTGERPAYRIAEGGVFAAPNPPHTSSVPEPSRVVHRLMSAVADFDATYKAVMADDNLSDAGKERKLAPKREAAREAIAAASKRMSELSSEVQLMRAETFTAPKLARDDIVGALEDRELRDWLRGLDDERATAVSMTLAENPRLQEAILRSPAPLPRFNELATRMYAERAAVVNPEANRVIQHQEATEWGALLVQQVSDAMAWELKPADPFAAAKAA